MFVFLSVQELLTNNLCYEKTVSLSWNFSFCSFNWIDSIQCKRSG